MRYRRVGTVEISEIGLDCPSTTRLNSADVRSIVERGLGRGVNFLRAVEPEETSALGDALSALGARRSAVLAAGIGEFFSSFARHHMTLGEFLEHELNDQLSRAKSDYLDCFFIDIGAGRSVDLGAVLQEDLRTGDSGGHKSFEGGTFLHETIAEAVVTIERFKKAGRVRLSGIGGENLSVLKRILIKNKNFDLAFVPYNYAFRIAAEELIPIATETKTAVVATRPLWWGVRSIPVTVLTESPFPNERFSLGADEGALTRIACKWPLANSGVTSVMAEANSLAPLDTLSEASTDRTWTRADEEALSKAFDVANAQQGLFIILSAMNSPDDDIRARGWAAYIRRGLPECGFDPFASEASRLKALRLIASAVVKDETLMTHEGLDDLE